MLSDDALRRVLPATTVALLGDLIRALLWGLAAIVWLSFAQVYLRMIRLGLSDPSNSDFTIFYYTARLVADGLPMYGESPARYGVEWAATHLGNLNPPHFQLLFVPLAALSYGQALLVWVAISAACVVTALVVIVRELEVPFTWRRLVAWGALTVGLAPFTTVAVTSEVTFVLMLPFALMWRAWRRGQWRAAGLWLGVLASLKLFFLVLVGWLVLARRWRALAYSAATVLALVAAGTLTFGADTYRLWLGSLGRVGWEWMAMNASLPGFVDRLFHSGGKITPVASWPALVRPLTAAGAAFVLAASLRATWREREPARAVEADHVVLVLLLGAILASPLGWVYYLPLAYAPILGWMGAGTGWATVRRLPRAWMFALVSAVVLLYLPQELANAAQPSRMATLTLASAYFYATCLIWLSAVCNRA
jgi:hypothetical protein